jgi:hypothetical protein
MNTKRHPHDRLIRRSILCAALAAAVPAFAASADLPPEHRDGVAAPYRSGGVGEDEAKAMREIAHQYPLALEFIARERDGRNAYLSDVNVSIRDGRGNEVLQTTADGPFLLARLPAGRYVVTAKYENAQHARRITVPARGTEHVVFAW